MVLRMLMMMMEKEEETKNSQVIIREENKFRGGRSDVLAKVGVMLGDFTNTIQPWKHCFACVKP